MTGSLQGETVLVVGRGSGIARAIVDAAVAEGTHVVTAGRNRVALEAAHTDTTVSVKYVDVTDDTSIAAPADEVGSVHHVVSTVSARARGAVGELSPEAIPLSFHTKGVDPIMPAQTLRSEDAEDGSFVLFSGGGPSRAGSRFSHGGGDQRFGERSDPFASCLLTLNA